MTAVEWYDAQLKEIDYKLQSGLINLTQCKVLMDEAKSQAKEMEKEQSNAKIQKAIEVFEEAKRQADIAKDVIYLDGVLAVLDGIKNTKL